MKTCKTLQEYLDAIFALWRDWTKGGELPEETWYRGVGDVQRHHLIPGLYRQDDPDEVSVMTTFEAKAPSYSPSQPKTPAEWYLLAQHYGLPTRLLDWSESPLVALYFALHSCKNESTPAVWAIDAARLNKLSTQAEFTRQSNGKVAAHWLPEDYNLKAKRFKIENRACTNKYPLAIIPSRCEPRIVAQQGMFTVHGTSRISINQFMRDAPAGKNYVRCVKIDPAQVEAMKQQLYVLGIRRHCIFPDLQSLAASIKEDY